MLKNKWALWYINIDTLLLLPDWWDVRNLATEGTKETLFGKIIRKVFLSTTKFISVFMHYLNDLLCGNGPKPNAKYRYIQVSGRNKLHYAEVPLTNTHNTASLYIYLIIYTYDFFSRNQRWAVGWLWARL